MKRPPIALFIAVVLIANAAALWHAWQNRSGQPEAVITLTQHELRFVQNADEGGVMLHLRIVKPQVEEPAPGTHQRTLPRSAYVALEYRGSANPEKDLSRLIELESAATAAQLRQRFPDRTRVVILPCSVLPDGRVVSIPSLIYVPLPHSRIFESAPKAYQVQLTYGSKLEPWVTSVTATPAPQ